MAWWIITQIPLPPPFPIIVRVVFAVIVLIVLVELLLPYATPGVHIGVR